MVKCILAVKSHLPIGMGTLKEQMDAGKPLYSFEATEVAPILIHALLEEFDRFDVCVRLTKESGGAEEEISREIFLNLLESGQLIARQVEEDMEREADEG